MASKKCNRFGTGNSHPKWKGGRVVASNGYVLIRVGTAHHLADVRGYAYEHRLVAETMIGRRLIGGEEVHHINGDRADNSPENIEIKESRAHHKMNHRKNGSGRRSPRELNSEIECMCGCGETFLKYDKWGRPRRFVSGHNMKDGV